MGAKDKAGFYPVRVSGSPYVVRISGSSLGDVVGKKPADFIAKPAASSSGASGAGGGLQRLTAPPAGPSGGTAGGTTH